MCWFLTTLQKEVSSLPQRLLKAKALVLSTLIEESIARKAYWNQALTFLNDPLFLAVRCLLYTMLIKRVCEIGKFYPTCYLSSMVN